MFSDLFIAFSPLLVSLFLFLVARKWIINYLFTTFMKVLLSDKYQENLFEMLPAARRIGLIAMMENQLRAQNGSILYRSMGSSKNWPNLESIMFIPAQTTPFPIDKETAVDLSQTIGPAAKKPLQIDIPIMVGGMAYGLALSKEAKLALAKASAKMKTAINSGEGGILPEEQEAAHKYILQFSKTAWGKDEQLIGNADMIEIKLGQGALAGMGERIESHLIPKEARASLDLNEQEDAVIHETFFENQTLTDLKELIIALREASDGVPIGVKLLAGGRLEEDLDRLIEIGVDFVALEGGQGGTYGAPPILQDDFGIPTLHAIVRADKHLRVRKVKNRISLIASGGLNVPGDFLKALALGADAIYIGSAIIYAINHNQLLKPLPWEPPSQTIWSTGSMKDDFDVEKGAESGYRFFKACVEEMKMALRAMGKTSLKELSSADLVSYDETVAKMTNIPFTFASQSRTTTKNKRSLE